MSNETLKALNAAMHERHHFEVGQLVEWKPGLKNKRCEGPFVVHQVLEEPVFDGDKQNSGTPYFREPLDLLLGSVDRDADFVVYHYDSRRFQPVEEEL